MQSDPRCFGCGGRVAWSCSPVPGMRGTANCWEGCGWTGAVERNEDGFGVRVLTATEAAVGPKPQCEPHAELLLRSLPALATSMTAHVATPTSVVPRPRSELQPSVQISFPRPNDPAWWADLDALVNALVDAHVQAERLRWARWLDTAPETIDDSKPS